MTCPDPEVLMAFSRGGLESPQRQRLETHIDGCPACSRVVAELARIYTSARSSLPSDVDPVGGDEDTLVDDELPPEPGSCLHPGARLDRYTVLDHVGSGGMGVVYAAYDPMLDRKVALKVLHDRGRSDERARRRLVREAQAMAKLSHPNVITVHEVREAEGRVFISMEFVGRTLSRWIAETEPTLPRLLTMFRGIGRGLAAAHAVGLVHSDVKPDNVLIGDDERPRVTDFGLARLVVDDSPALEPPGAAPRTDQDVPATATRTKGLMGTPAYMAPEQLLRDPPTAASDQFSFCVTLYESLWGTRPFTGRSLAQLAHNVLEGVRTEPQRDVSVPRWLRSVVMRGLSLRPQDRWPSMDALIERLEPGPRRARRRLAVATALGLGLVLTATVTNRVLSAPPDPCDGGHELMQEAWGSSQRTAVERSLARGSTRYAEDTAALAIGRVDAYADAWATAYRETCESYHHGGQSAEAFDLRGACLDERRRELEALVDVLIEGDPEVQHHAVEAVDGLRSLAPCEDVEVLRARVPPPEDQQVRARVKDGESRLARVRALSHAGKYDEGLALAEAAVDHARGVGYPPLLARALWMRAALLTSAGDIEAAVDDLRETWRHALAAGDDALAAEAAVGLVERLGYSLMRYDDAEIRDEEAEAVLERVRRYDPRQAEAIAGRLSFARGQIALRHHRYDDAIERFEEALRVVEQREGAESLAVTYELSAIATAWLAKGDWHAAEPVFRRVYEIRTEHLGAEHPMTAQAGNNLGLALKNQQRFEDAAEVLERSLAQQEASLGADHPSSRMARGNLATVYFVLRRYDEAAALFDRVYPDLTAEAIDDEYVLRRVQYYAVSLSRAGRTERALEVLGMVETRARALEQRSTLRSVFAERARVALTKSDPERALALLDEVEEIGETMHPPFVAEVSLTRARALVGLEQHDAARALVPKIRAGVDAKGAPTTADLEALLADLGEAPTR